MDFITGLPKVQGKDCIYVVVDRLTKFAHFYSIPIEYNAVQVAELFFREFFRIHGCRGTSLVTGTVGSLGHFGESCQVATFRRALLQHHFPHVHWYDTLQRIVRI
jgi:hypothetical protein